ncbi:MAG: T9SS type A sorting domain-containing protein [Tannerella sp.]|nr:T9SS type A sorting domain-containing protein [Tannerella sp.]
MNLYKIIKPGLLKSLFACLNGILLFHSPHVLAQISEGGLPPSFGYQQLLRSTTAETKVPVNFYVEDLLETDNWLARDGVPVPVAKLIPVDYTMDNSGYWTTLPGGETIWRLHLKADDAIAVMLYYNDFYIPEGGKLFIYSADKSQLLGAYTRHTHLSGGLFATEFIGGDELILEYVVSRTSEETPRISVNEIGYGYNAAALRAFCGITTRSTSGSCMVNVNCEEGDAWQNEKKSVCYSIQKIGSKNYICSASLMNNTAEDFKPLILTAYHCAYDGSSYATGSNMQQWMFYFHREREDCSNNSLAAVSKTMTGCKMLANTGMSGGSDGLLLQLNDIIPEDYDVFYNGWDRRGIAASSGACIHHPSGDYKKISTYSGPSKEYTFQSTEFTADTYAHWNVTFVETVNGHGVTEEGSSGSPLFNENKLVIGTLTGGSSSCSSRKGLNIYGKMNYHWNKYTSDSSTRMDVWLDPLNLGAGTLAGRFRKTFKPSPQNLKAVNLGQSISLTWSAPENDEPPKRYNVYLNNNKIYETTSLSYIDHEPGVGSLVYSISAVYANEEESSFATTTISYIKYKAPSDLKAERLEPGSNQIQLSWNAPVYEQTIHWGNLEGDYMAGLGNKTPFYYGQKWSSDEISPLNGKTIKAVQFIPIGDNAYEIYISQGENFYKQNIESYSIKNEELNTISLKTPFVIDGSKSLIVSIYASVVRTDYPAVCDNGPAIDGKGNIYSNNGNEWYKFYDRETPDKYNYNFIVAAVISSESGDLSNNSKSYDIFGRSSEIIIGHRNVQPHTTALSLDDNTVSLRSLVPAVFPEITKYRIYRNGSIYQDIIASKTTCTEYPLQDSYYYEVSAFYDGIESEKSNKANIPHVNTESIDASIGIFPTRFFNYISLKGNESVTRIEVVSVSGKICLVVNNPDETIDTSSLSPGLYFFRIYDHNNKQKVIKAIKAN